MDKLKTLYDKIVRPTSKLTDILSVAFVLSLLVIFGGSLLSMVVLKLPFVSRFLRSLVYSESMYEFLENYVVFFGIWIVILLNTVIYKGNRPMLKAIRYSHRGNNLTGFLMGILLGFGTNGFCVLMSLLAGDIKLSFYGFDFVVLLTFAIAVFIQSGAEELTDRFFLYQKLRRRYCHPAITLLGNSIIFALLHVGNPGFTVVAGIQIFLVGLVFSLMVYYYNNLWGAMSFHAAWNYTQNIIFGLPNSGIVSEYSIFRLEAASARNGLFYNVSFGVEGSIGSCLLLGLLAAVILYLNRNRSECLDVWAESEEKPNQ